MNSEQKSKENEHNWSKKKKKKDSGRKLRIKDRKENRRQ